MVNYKFTYFTLILSNNITTKQKTPEKGTTGTVSCSRFRRKHTV